MHAQPQKTVNSQNASKSYTKKCLYANIPYRLQPYHKYKYLCVQLNTYANVNLMPESVYKLVFNGPERSKLAKNDSHLTVYTRHSVDLIGKCTFFMLSKDMKQPVEVDCYIAIDDGSVFLSSETVLQLQLLDVKQRLEYLPPRVTLISSAADYPRKELHAQSRSIKQQHGTEAAHYGSIIANLDP